MTKKVTSTVDNVANITSGQIRQIVQAGSAPIEQELIKAELDKERAQHLITNNLAEFQARIAKAARKAYRELSITNQYTNEEVKSSYGYPDGYKPKALNDQYAILRAVFPKLLNELGPVSDMMLPGPAEATFVIPDWRHVSSSYAEAVNLVLTAIASVRRFYNHREGQITDKQLRRCAKTESLLDTFRSQYKSDWLIIPAQFGMNHRGRSVRRARSVFSANEFGLGAFEVGCMLLTHSERLTSYNDLGIDCPGDEFDDPDDAQRWFGAPCFNGDGLLGFVTNWVRGADGNFGSASGFLPQ